ncbi:hypothetical protein [Ostreibacterium oceani]|nr:hypothetical protein [Ostreibacterium oceani]
MGNIALIYRFGFFECCDMAIAEIVDWNNRAIAYHEASNGD